MKAQRIWSIEDLAGESLGGWAGPDSFAPSGRAIVERIDVVESGVAVRVSEGDTSFNGAVVLPSPREARDAAKVLAKLVGGTLDELVALGLNVVRSPNQPQPKGRARRR
jgi:hypothetical protein